MRGGLTVAVVEREPGPAWTVLDLAGQRFPDGRLKVNLDAADPMGRATQPGELVRAYVCLASESDSGYAIGEAIVVTGGMTGSC
ncbi:short-chain dehydrogenase/reductase SDR [Streptomyces longispororuber]|uniref:short-chain dehydrogenase/reductase SDR n=1 Tax=Streptomyces longispororuber TaxID=68230 RepID=UPI00210941F0|nr:short-chain dehydrogenase/reductase SDR [Streptomyces longispororuber]MCQ4209979.1 short-chain dehydrogenase/reductase SDR [Streptomyces longispororuber]